MLPLLRIDYPGSVCTTNADGHADSHGATTCGPSTNGRTNQPGQGVKRLCADHNRLHLNLEHLKTKHFLSDKTSKKGRYIGDDIFVNL